MLGSTAVSDLAPLADLQKLSVLFLNDTEVSDLVPLAELTELAELDLRDTLVSDSDALGRARKLDSAPAQQDPSE